MIQRRSIVTAPLAAAAISATVGSRAWAQSRLQLASIIVGFPAGGSTDVVARFLADKLRGSYADTMMVDNKPGAAARIAQDHLKQAPADGSVICLTPAATLTLYPHVFRKLNYRNEDFIPVTPICSFPLALVVGPAVPALVRTVADYIKWAKADPRNATIGIGAPGAPPEFAAAMLGRAAGVKPGIVGYKGGAPLIQDLLGGHIPAGVNVLAEPLPHLQGGKLRALAVTGASRSRYLPEVPTMAEAGIPDPVPQGWFGVFLPARTPPHIVTRLNETIRQALAGPEVQEVFAKFGFEKYWLPSSDFSRLIETELVEWGRIVQATGYVPQE